MTSLPRAYEEVVDFIAAANPSAVVAFRPSEGARQRAFDLIQREKAEGLSPDEPELEHTR